MVWSFDLLHTVSVQSADRVFMIVAPRRVPLFSRISRQLIMSWHDR